MSNAHDSPPTLVRQIERCLTINRQGAPKQIVQVDRLMQRHSLKAVGAYLAKVRHDYQQRLKQLARVNPASPQLDHLVVMVFRLGLAIQLIQRQEPTHRAA